MAEVLPELRVVPEVKEPATGPAGPRGAEAGYPRDAPVYLLDELAARRLLDFLTAERRGCAVGGRARRPASGCARR